MALNLCSIAHQEPDIVKPKHHTDLRMHNSTTIDKIQPAWSTRRVLMILILLLQATSFIQFSLLLRCGDIESNPGPGIYPGKWTIIILCAENIGLPLIITCTITHIQIWIMNVSMVALF